MEEAPEIAEALRCLVTGVGEIMPRVIPLNLAARASDDPELARVMAESEAWRADGYRTMLDILRAKAPLCGGLDPERANHLLLLYAGEDVYHFLVGTYGWSHEEWVDWTVAVLLHEVFGRTSPAPRLSENAVKSAGLPGRHQVRSSRRPVRDECAGRSTTLCVSQPHRRLRGRSARQSPAGDSRPPSTARACS